MSILRAPYLGKGGLKYAPTAFAATASESANPHLWVGLVAAPAFFSKRSFELVRRSPPQSLGTQPLFYSFSEAGVLGNFDGNQRIEYPFTPVLGSQNRTVVAYASFSNNVDQVLATFGGRVGGGNGERYTVRLENSPAAVVRTEVNGGFKYGTTPLNDGRLRSIVSRLDGSDVNGVNHYVDGRLEAVGAAGNQAINTLDGGFLEIGIRTSSTGDSDQAFSGRVSYMLFYDWALPESYLKQLAEDPYAPFRKRSLLVSIAAPGGGVNVEPTAATTQTQALAPTVATGAIASPTAAATVAQALNPTIATGAVVAPGVAQTLAAALAPSIATGASVNPPAAQTVSAALDPVLSVAAAVSPPAAVTQSQALVPTVAAGASVSPPAAQTTAAALSPTVSIAAAVSPPAAVTVAQALVPAVAAGASVQPPAAQTTSQALVPTITGGLAITPPAAVTHAQALSPTVAAGASVRPPAAATISQALVPSVTGAIVINPTVAVTQAQAHAPTVAAGASVRPTVAYTSSDALPPTVATGAFVSPPAAVTAAGALAPEVFAGVVRFVKKATLKGVLQQRATLQGTYVRRVRL